LILFAAHEVADAQALAQIVNCEGERNEDAHARFYRRTNTDAQPFDQLLGGGPSGKHGDFIIPGRRRV
jgi:hypothetical protein